MKKAAKVGTVASQTNFRWTNDDLEAQLPERFEKALNECGFTFSGTVRAMIRGFTEDIEQYGPPRAIRHGIESARTARPERLPAHMLNEPESSYGANGRPPRGKQAPKKGK